MFTVVLAYLLPTDEPLLQKLATIGSEAVIPSVLQAQGESNNPPSNESEVRRQRQLRAYSLQNDYTPPARDAWHRSIGIFANDLLAAEVFAEVEQAREAERPAE